MAADLQKAQQIYDSMSAEQRKQFEQQYGGEQKAQDFLQSQQDRTPTQPQSTTRTQSTPTPKQEIQPQEAPTATTQQGRPELLPESDYKDDSDQRQRGIVANLNEAVYLNPQSLSDYNTFANYYNYEGRSDLQKQTLDNRYLGYQKSQEYSTKSVKELQSLYNANVISQSDLSLLKVYDPNKYNELNSLISKTADLKTYADQLSGTEITTPTNPFQGIIDNFVQGLQSFSQTNFYDEYRDTINSPALKQKNQEIIAEQAEMERLDLLINNKRKDVEERYAGTGATKSKIAAIIADETYELQLEKANRAITLNAMVNSYNSELGNAREELNLKLQEYNMGLQQRQQQMQELGFAMSLMNFETNAQRDEREWNNFIRQQEYQNGDIFSNDPKVRNKAIEKAVDTVLQEFSGIPMIRSREQMVEDITVLVNGGMSLGEAITKNIRDPIMQKPEYKNWLQQKFPPQTVSMGGISFRQDSNGDLTPVKINNPRTGGQIDLDETVINTGIKNVYGSDVKLKPTVASMVTQAQTALSQQGITLKIADSYRSSETQKNAYESGKPGVAPAGKSRHEKGQAIDLSQTGSDNMNNEEVFNALRAAGLQQHPGERWHWSYGEFGGATGNTSGGDSSTNYNPDNAELYDEYLTSKKAPAKYILEGLGITVDNFIKQAKAYESSEYSNREPSFKNQDQALAFGYAQRVQAALPILNSGDEYISGMSASEYALARNLPNWAKSPKMQQQMQAERDFVNAILRRESGAAIAESEFTSAKLQYFPQPGDSKEVIAQKERNRMLQLDNLARSTGNYWYFDNTTPTITQTNNGGVASGPNQDTSVNLTNSILQSLYPTSSPIINTSNPLLR